MLPTQGHVASTQASFKRAVPQRQVLHLFPCWRGVSCGPPLEMMWTAKLLTWLSLSLTWGVTWTTFGNDVDRQILTWHSLLLTWTLCSVKLYVLCAVWQTSTGTGKCHVRHLGRRRYSIRRILGFVHCYVWRPMWHKNVFWGIMLDITCFYDVVGKT